MIAVISELDSFTFVLRVVTLWLLAALVWLTLFLPLTFAFESLFHSELAEGFGSVCPFAFGSSTM